MSWPPRTRSPGCRCIDDARPHPDQGPRVNANPAMKSSPVTEFGPTLRAVGAPRVGQAPQDSPASQTRPSLSESVPATIRYCPGAMPVNSKASDPSTLRPCTSATASRFESRSCTYRYPTSPAVELDPTSVDIGITTWAPPVAVNAMDA